MKILLFNDNPVVRKLVALSAQKTKDELSVVWSADEIEEREYDLLIVDDALYSDEMFESLQEKIEVKSKLYMATRGNPLPKGFDNVINKPFLPTDLVDMFIQIENKVGGSSHSKDETAVETPVYSINLEETLPDLEHHDEFEFGEDMDEEGIDLSTLDELDETPLETGILDKEEVQEVQELLEAAEDESIDEDEGIVVKGIDELDFDESPLEEPEDAMFGLEDEPSVDEIKDEFSFDDEIVSEEMKGELLQFDDILEEEKLKLQDDDFEEESVPSEPLQENAEETFDAELLSDLDVMENEEEWDESTLEEMDISSLMDDHELENLGSTIEEAIDGLEEGELDRELSSDDFGFELDESILDGLAQEPETSATAPADPLDGLDELDMLDEKELKRAIGEEVDEETEDALDEPFESDTADEAEWDIDGVETETAAEEKSPLQELSSPAEGVEALQALLKALSNEEVAKSLKALNISININFGNEK